MVCSRQSRQSCMLCIYLHVHTFTCTLPGTLTALSKHAYTHAWVLCSFDCEALDEFSARSSGKVCCLHIDHAA